MKVVHLLAELRPSGMERMLVSAAPYFSRADVDSVVVGQGSEHPFEPELRAAGYRVRTIPRVKSPGGVGAWARALREEQPDVVHIHTEGVFSMSVLCARLAAPKALIVRTLHSFFLADGWWGVKRRAQAYASDRFVDSFITLNPEMARHEAGFRRSSVIIPNWVDDRFLDTGDPGVKDLDLVLVGNCSPVKDHSIVLSVALAEGWSVAHFGNESEIEEKEAALLEALEGTGKLVWRGVGDPLPWIQRARVFAMPSTREGFPVALAEAVALGAVCVVSDAPGFEWAREYPLVSYVAGRDKESWRTAILQAMTVAQAPETGSIRHLQRERARSALSAEVGAGRYMQVYRGGSPESATSAAPPSSVSGGDA